MPPELDIGLRLPENWIPYVDTLTDAEAIELNTTANGTTHSWNIWNDLVNSPDITVTTNSLNDFTISWRSDINSYDSALEFDYDKQDSIRVASSVMKQLVEEIKKLQERNDFLEAQNEKTLEQIWDKIIN